MPPGPRGWPLFGNIFQLDLNNPLPQFAIWREKFGKIFKINLVGQNIVLVSQVMISLCNMQLAAVVQNSLVAFVF